MRNILAALLLIYIVSESLKVKFGYIPIIQKSPSEKIAEEKAIEENVKNKTEDNNSDYSNEDKSQNNNNTTEERVSENKEYNHQGSYSEKLVSKVVTNLLKTDEGQKFFSKLITPIGTPKIDKAIKFKEVNSLENIFSSKIIQEGSGENVANCGDDVSITYYIYDIANQLISTKNVNTKIGSNNVIPLVMGNIAIGMRENEKKSSLINRDLIDSLEEGQKFVKNNSAKMRIEILLNKIYKSQANISENEFTYFDDGIAPIQKFCLCGEFVEVMLEVYSMENKLLFKDNLRFKIGDKNIPKVINSVIIGLTYDIKRTIITKAKNINSIKNYKKNFDLEPKDNDYIKIKISLI